MKKIPAAIGGIFLFVVALSSQAITLSIDPASQTVTAGSSVNIALVISGLGDLTAPSLSTFDLDISFDPTLLTFSNATFGDPVLGDQLDLFGLGSLTSVTQGVGTVNLFELSFDSSANLDTLQAGRFTLATLSFNTLATGVSPVDIVTVNALGDSLGNLLATTVSNGSVTVEPTAPTISNPPTLMLLMTGLFGMLGWNKKYW